MLHLTYLEISNYNDTFRSIDVNEEQPLNKETIIFKFLYLKNEMSIEDNEEQP